MRTELKKIHDKLGTTFIYVTHDQVEAMSMGTQIIVMNQGKVMQDSKPSELYNNPSNVFTAKFIGSPPMNIISIDENNKKFYETSDPSIKYIGFRSEDTKIVDNPDYSDSMCFLADLTNVEPLGSETIYSIENNLGTFQIKSYDKEIIDKDEVIIEVAKEDLKYFDSKENLIENPDIVESSEERSQTFDHSDQEKREDQKTYISD